MVTVFTPVSSCFFVWSYNNICRSCCPCYMSYSWFAAVPGDYTLYQQTHHTKRVNQARWSNSGLDSLLNVLIRSMIAHIKQVRFRSYAMASSALFDSAYRPSQMILSAHFLSFVHKFDVVFLWLDFFFTYLINARVDLPPWFATLLYDIADVYRDEIISGTKASGYYASTCASQNDLLSPLWSRV